METTQSFRLAGSTDIVKITCDQEDGQNVIYWDDIIDIFPGAQYVKNGDVAVKKMRTNGPGRDKAQRIKHHPGVVLDVILSTHLANDPTESPLKYPRPSATIGQTSDSTEAALDSSTDDNVVENPQVSTLDSTIHMGNHGDCHTSSFSASILTSSSVNNNEDSTMLSFEQAVQLDQKHALGSTIEQRLVSFLPHDVQAQVIVSSDTHDRIIQAIQSGLVDRPHEQLVACLQDLKDAMDRNNQLALRNNELALRNNELVLKINGLVLNVQDLALKNNELVSNVQGLALKNNELTSSNMESTALVIKMQEAFNVKQDEMKQLQIQALDQLALLQNRVQALMTQTYELHEYPIPRLFVVLPQDTSSWNPADIVSNKFRLYFLCECGEHTKQPTSKIPHHIHLAKHEGYEITRPKEFFRQFGRYILTILKMLKFGVSVAGVAIPAVSLLVRADALDKATSSLKMLTGNLQTGLEQSIGCIEKLASDNGEPCDRALDQLANNEGLEGADLRKLETFLKNKDGSKVLGNLYRTTTSKGHVKWVCIDHYRENYHEKEAKTFRDTVESMGGAYDENIGRVKIRVRTKIQADRFYQALDKARLVYELEIGLDWDTTYSDFKKLRDCLFKSNVGALHINLHRQKSPASDALNRGKRYDPIMNIMQHPSTHSVSIMEAPDDFIRRSSLLSRNDDFPYLRNLDIDLTTFRKDVPGLKTMISRMPNLTSLTMNESEDKSTRICSRCGTEDGLQRSLQVNDGHMKVYVCSGLQADLAYQVLEVSKSINGFNTDLVVDLKDNTADDISDSTQRYDSIFNIMRHPSTHSLVIRGVPGDFIQRSTLLPNNDGFPSLKHLDINFSTSRQDVSSLKTMISKMSNLTSLIVNDSGDRRAHICDGCDTVDTMERSFEVIDGGVKIFIRSRIQAELVLQVLENNTSISGLDTDLHVELKDDSSDGITDRTRGHDSIFDIMRRPCTHSVVIVEPPEDFIQQSSLTSRDYRFPNVKHLNIDLSVSTREIPGLKTMVSRMPNITSLTVNDSDKRSNQVDGASDTVDSFERLFKVNEGRATINLRSRIQLDLVYPVLENIQSIYGLGIDLFVDLKDISIGDTSHRIQQHDSIFDIMRHPSTHSVVIMNAPEDFIRQSSMLSRNDDFSHLKRLDIDISALKQDADGITNLVSRMSNLSHLCMNDSLYTRGQFHGGIMAMESLNGPSDTNCDRVIVHVESRELVELAYTVLEKVKTAYELDLGLHWSITQGDMDRLRGILGRTNISSLKLHVDLSDDDDSTSDDDDWTSDDDDSTSDDDDWTSDDDDSTSDDDDSTREVSDRIQRHDSFFDILRHPSTHSVVVVGAPRDLIQQSSIMSRNNVFNLKRLYIDVSALKQDINGIKTLISRAPNLTHLSMNNPSYRKRQFYENNITEALEEPFDVDSDCLMIRVGSRKLMELAYEVQAKIKSTYRLDIGLRWATTHSDIERLQDILAQGNVSALKLHVNLAGGKGDQHLRHDSLFNVMRHPSTQSVAIVGPPAGFIQGSSLLFQKEGFPNLRHLDIDLSLMEETFSDLKGLLARTTGLSSLGFQGDIQDLLLVRLFLEIAEYQTYPITFTGMSLCIPPLATLSDQSPTLHHCLSHFLGVLDVNGVTLSLVLYGGIKEAALVDTLAKVEMDRTGFKTLELWSNQDVGSQFIKNVGRIVSRSDLRRLAINLKVEEGEERVQIVESIQWKHMRSLEIHMDKESTGTRAMKLVVEGRDKEQGQVELDYFKFYSYSTGTESSECAALCKSFVASTSIKKLDLLVYMTPSDMEFVFNSMDVTRLEEIWLRARVHSSSQVDRVLDCLTNAHNLREVELSWYTPTQEQIQRMQQRGVTLRELDTF